MTDFNGTLDQIHRLPSSINGNPRFRALIVDERGGIMELRTAPDSDVAYGLSNYIGKRVSGRFRTYYGHPTLTHIEEAGA